MRAASRFAVAGGLLFVALALSCGDDGPPVCPTGNCTLPGNTVVKYKFNNYSTLGFDSDTCSELSVDKVRVELIGVTDTTAYDVREVDCPEGQATFSDLAVQQYNIAVTPLDADGNPLIKTDMPGRGMIDGAGPGGRTETTVDVQFESWARQYTGQFLFKLTWQGMSCAASGTGVVTKHALTLTVNGVVVAQHTTNPPNPTLTFDTPADAGVPSDI
jgi:hypothetical protein